MVCTASSRSNCLDIFFQHSTTIGLLHVIFLRISRNRRETFLNNEHFLYSLHINARAVTCLPVRSLTHLSRLSSCHDTREPVRTVLLASSVPDKDVHLLRFHMSNASLGAAVLCPQTRYPCQAVLLLSLPRDVLSTRFSTDSSWNFCKSYFRYWTASSLQLARLLQRVFKFKWQNIPPTFQELTDLVFGNV